ncbi:DUF3298 and DUF4163 domain-containing protein [Sphingobacterium rhinopitheci]|uniref:DUF3298 and DUF4163 domain-containing protein n=1 Tax=Sphingobacterium rhinopitheci TaxID=2781960 RepID=UPI001F525FE0|nr:DUF3298 and DUF4163 domain-containing protein [Sphingobacterium rhinopitheci]MCI0919936.1 DUF3298 domain-containing protein [Sphingobacterium rhinopitheci]
MSRLLIYIPLLFSACNNLPQANTKTNTNLHLNTIDTITYSYNTISEHSEFFIANEDIIDTTYFKITYPIFSKDNLNDSIKKYILIDGENTPAEAAQSFIDGYDEFASDLQGNGIHGTWFKDVNSQVILNTPMLISLATQVNEYSGGAHGQHYTLYANFDLHRNQTIILEDILQKDKLKELTAIAEKHFRKQENIYEKESLSKDFFFEDGIFTLNDNFGFTKNSLIIYYNEYEIRPYADGPTILEIPYKDLKDVFNIRGQEFVKSIL